MVEEAGKEQEEPVLTGGSQGKMQEIMPDVEAITVLIMEVVVQRILGLMEAGEEGLRQNPAAMVHKTVSGLKLATVQ